MRYFKTFAEAYELSASELLQHGDVHSPRGSETREMRNYLYTITDPYSNLYENAVRSVPKQYLANELIWYLSGSNNVKFISKRASLWNKIKNPDGKTVNSAYGHLLFNDPNEHGISEWEWAKQSLMDDNDSRQSVIRFNKPKHSWFGNRDFVCTFYGIFMIRDNKLHLTIHQRSCDIMTGLTYDVPFFMLLLQLMINELKYENDLDLEMGTFTHMINSLHVYEKDYEKLDEMIDAQFFPDKLPIVEMPDLRDILSGVISEGGIITHKSFMDREGAISADPLLDWMFTKSKWNQLLLRDA